MSGKIINFEDKKINKSNFYKNKKLFNIHDLDVNKILVSKKESGAIFWPYIRFLLLLLKYSLIFYRIDRNTNKSIFVIAILKSTFITI